MEDLEADKRKPEMKLWKKILLDPTTKQEGCLWTIVNAGEITRIVKNIYKE